MLACVIFVVECAQTEQAPKVDTSGFSRDYSHLRPGGEGEALLVYENPQADFSTYRTVYVEPVIVLLSKQSSIPQEEIDKLGGDLRSKVIWKLKEDFLVVPKLVPGALRVELALTEAVPADVGMDIITTLVPPVEVLSGAAGWEVIRWMVQWTPGMMSIRLLIIGPPCYLIGFVSGGQ